MIALPIYNKLMLANFQEMFKKIFWMPVERVPSAWHSHKRMSGLNVLNFKIKSIEVFYFNAWTFDLNVMTFGHLNFHVTQLMVA